jgi:hypothetical protein
MYTETLLLNVLHIPRLNLSLSQIKSNPDRPLFVDSILSGLKDRVLYSRRDQKLDSFHP